MRYEVENLPDFDDFDALYDALLKEKSIKYREKVRDGADERKAIRDLGEEIWEEIYQRYGVKPVFEKW
ncbi:MAG: hypothetical protein HFI71_03820 [Lachnospiraceae bacterium]|jgi:hypothetical protein|nr:hypothetical protein [Lachnospiraceae bacterium]